MAPWAMGWGAVAIAGLVGCGPASQPAQGPPAAAPSTPAHRHLIRRVMVPAELGAPDALARIPWRVRRARPGTIRLAFEDEDLQTAYGTTSAAWPAIAESVSMVQVVTETETTRIAVWFPRRDLVTVVGEDVAVAATPGGDGDVERRATIRAGAKIVRGESRDGAVEVFLDDPDLAVTGWVPGASIGKVYAAEAEPSYRDSCSVTADTSIALRPEAEAPVLARTVTSVAAMTTPGAPAGWQEVIAHTANAVVRGYVPANAIELGLTVAPSVETGTAPTGNPRPPRIVIPAGTCLYSNGEVVGVTTATASYTTGGFGSPASTWDPILVETALREVIVLAHVTSGNGVNARAANVTYESCTD